MNKLPWNPPKWKFYSFNGSEFKVGLETGEIYTGKLENNFIAMNPPHKEICYKIFGASFADGYDKELTKLSKVLNLILRHGYWPEYDDVPEFLKRYYERVAKIKKFSIKSIISIESEFNITPKFTL